MRIDTLSLALALSVAAQSAFACGFHGYTPQPTIVERLLRSDHVVLARPTEEQPFRFSDIEAIEGSAEFVEIPHLADSATRRKLAVNADDRVLFARDDNYGPWIRLAYVDSDLQPILADLIARLPNWELGEDAERFQFFAALLDHPSDRIHDLALRELDLADYGLLRGLPMTIDAERLLARINQPAEMDLRPIRLLLLGFSDEPAVVDILKAGFNPNATIGGGQLGARATALIENGGAEEASWLIDTYLLDQSVPQNNRELMTEALALHSSYADPDTRDAIRSLVSDAVERDPSLAPFVARQFGARNDWSQKDAFSALMRSGGLNSPLDALILTQYTAIADDAALQTGN